MGDFDKEDSYKNLERVNFWIANCDSKASFALALVGIFLSVFLTSDLTKGCLIRLFKEILKCNGINIKSIFIIIIILTMGATFFFLIRCIFNLLNTLTAKKNQNIYLRQSITANSFLFFDSISNRVFDGYINGLNNLSESEIINDINSQTYINSKICSAKFSSYNKAIENVKLAFILFIVTSFLLFIFDIFLKC